MKNRVIKAMTAGVLAVMLSVATVCAGPSITAGVTVPEEYSRITEESGVTDAQGNPVKEGTIEVIPTTDKETGETTTIITDVGEEVKTQIEAINDAIKEAAEKNDMTSFTKEMEKIVDEEQIVYKDKDDTFDVKTCAPLVKVNDVVVRDADGNVVEGAKNVDVKIEVPNLTKAIKAEGIRIMHYNIELGKWVVIKPEVDYDNKTLSFHLDVVGPIMVVYDPEMVETAE